MKLFLSIFISFSVMTASWTQGAERGGVLASSDLTKMSLEELMNVTVTIASKKEEKVSETAAAVYVITQEDIRRSGATSIPEALRMAPGVSVARIDANKWAISIRGFNDRYANKLLVLIDGRSVYTPLYSGTYWDVQDTLLEDVERIEIVRGPGGTLWGANAMNGVINIITKKAQDSQGGLITGSGGIEERAMGGVRYGAKIGDNHFFRVYGKYLNRDDFVLSTGVDSQDHWDMKRGGFRSDWELPEKDSLTLQGDYYSGDERETSARGTASNIDVSGGNVLARWNRSFSETSDMMVQFYYDRTDRKTSSLKEIRDTFDMDFHHTFALGNRQEFIWGLGYRNTSDETQTYSNYFSLNPRNKTDDLFSAFLQDDISFYEGRVHLIIGSKIEHNEYTGVEVQPNARVHWEISPRQSVWAAVSRAVRTPSRIETGQVSDYRPALPFVFRGNDNLNANELIANEIGYRVQPSKSLTLDVAAFYNIYRDLITDVSTQGWTYRGSPISDTYANYNGVHSHGLEAVANIQIADPWRLSTAYSFYEEKPNLPELKETPEDDDPQHQFNIRSFIDLPYDLEFDSSLFYFTRTTVGSRKIPDHFRFDLRLGWRPWESFEASLAVTDLFDDHHPEYLNRSVAPTEVERTFYGKVTWRF